MAKERPPQAGDILVLCNESGHWSRVFEFVRPDETKAGHMVVKERGTGEEFIAPPGLLRRPGVGSDCDDPPAVPGRDMVTEAQRRMIFARGQALGMSLDDIRAATPHGSVSALTKAEAHELVGKLTTRARPRAGQGTATGKQLATIGYLRDLVGFNEAEFSGWLAKWFKVESLAQVTSKTLASRIIGGLSRMRHNRMAGISCGSRGHGPSHPAAESAG